MDQNETNSPLALHRMYVEKAIREIRPYCSQQTGVLHLHPDLYAGMPAQAAPTYENFLFALLLFRRKTMETIQEGKALLTHLLSFQNLDGSSDQYGNFPPILTSYPVCRDWHLPIHLCLVITAMRIGFDSILGEELKERLHECHRTLLACAQNNQKKCYTSRWGACIIAMQKLLLHSPTDSTEFLQVFADASKMFVSEREWLHPEAFAKVLVAASQLQCDELSLPVSLIESAQRLWNPEASTYAGPALGVFQFGGVPETTLFDCLMSLYCNTPLKQRPWPYRTSLELALITPSEKMYGAPERSTQWGQENSFSVWSLGSLSVSACFFAPKMSELHGFHPIRIVTSSETVVFHFPSGQLLELSLYGRRFEGRVRITEIKEDDPSLLRAFVERHDGTTLLVDGKAASTFDPGKGISIVNEMGTIHISSEVPNSCCLGHVSLGNRPGQLIPKKRSENIAYDWKVSIDFIRGDVPKEYAFSFEIQQKQG